MENTAIGLLLCSILINNIYCWMLTLFAPFQIYQSWSTCLAVARVESPRVRPSLALAGLASSSQWGESTGSWGRNHVLAFALILFSQEGKLRQEGWGWCTCVYGCGHGILGCWDSWACRQCCQGQQEIAHHPKTPAASHQVRTFVDAYITFSP